MPVAARIGAIAKPPQHLNGGKRTKKNRAPRGAACWSGSPADYGVPAGLLSCFITFSRLKLAASWRGGNSWKLFRNSAT